MARFQGHAFLDAEYLRNGTRYRHSFNGILTGTCTRSSHGCHFEWPWVTVSDLAKYSMTRGVARSLCDSSASCWQVQCYVVPTPTDLLDMAWHSTNAIHLRLAIFLIIDVAQQRITCDRFAPPRVPLTKLAAGASNNVTNLRPISHQYLLMLYHASAAMWTRRRRGECFSNIPRQLSEGR